MTKRAAFLDDRGVVRVNGEDATGFLQGLLTNDVVRLGPHEARYAALLTPQGKILFDFLVVRAPVAADEFLLDCPAALAGDLAKRLAIYKLRAKVVVVDESADHGVIAYWQGEPENAPAGIFYADPREARLGRRAILPRAKAVAVGEASVAEYEALRIASRRPQGRRRFRLWRGLSARRRLGSLQRRRFREGLLRRPGGRFAHEAPRRGAQARRSRALDGPAPAPGAAVTDGELPVGVLGASSGRHALALLRLDRVEDAKAAGRALSAGGIEVVVTQGEGGGRP